MKRTHHTTSQQHPTQSYLGGIGTAEDLISQSSRGRIRLFGSWWSAIACDNVVIQPGQQIRVVSRKGMVLIVEPL